MSGKTLDSKQLYVFTKPLRASWQQSLEFTDCFLGRDLFKNYSFSIGPCTKKSSLETSTQKIWTYSEHDYLTSGYKISQDELICRKNQSQSATNNSQPCRLTASLQKGKTPNYYHKCPGYDIKQSDGEAPALEI